MSSVAFSATEQVVKYNSDGFDALKSRDYPHSVEAYSKAITLNHSDKETLEANRSVWLDAVKKDPNNLFNQKGLEQSYRFIGEAREELGPSTREERLQQQRKLFTRDKHMNNGVDLQSRKLYDSAIVEYINALELDKEASLPDKIDVEILFYLGSAYRDKGDFSTASDFYRKALYRKPDFALALEGLEFCEKRLQEKNAKPDNRAVK